MGRFASTVAYYESARPPYGGGFFAEAAARLGLGGRERLLDLGTGPGLLALGFAPHVGDAVGVDPEPGMLDLARAAAARVSRGTVPRFVAGRAEDLPADLGVFDLVTIGRALHWMDPAPTCAVLERVVAPGGSILVCGAATQPSDANPWLAAYEAVRRRWGEADPPGHRHKDRDAFFADTRFRRRDAIALVFEQEVTPERLADRVLSMSTSSPERLGDDREPMREAILAALAPFAPTGVLRETVEARADVFA